MIIFWGPFLWTPVAFYLGSSMGNVPSQRNWWKTLLPPRFPIYPIQCLPADLRAWLWWTGSANWGVCKEGKGLVTLYPLPFCLPPLGTTDFLFPVCSTIEASSLFLQIILHSFFSLISVDKVQLFSTKWEPFTSRVYSPLQPYSYFSPPPPSFILSSLFLSFSLPSIYSSDICSLLLCQALC